MLSTTSGKLLNEYTKDYVIFDLETTGVDSSCDEVIEISAVKVEGEKVIDEFSRLVNPGVPIPFWATDVNGITDDMVENEAGFETVLLDFIDFVGDMTLVGHNIHSFDMKFIYRDCRKYFSQTLSNDYIDTLRLSRIYLPSLERHRLVDLAYHYNISAEGAHRALNDCYMNQKVFHNIGKEMSEKNMRKNGIKVCPRCGAAMMLRNGKFGEFLGCTAYPECRYTENIKRTSR